MALDLSELLGLENSPVIGARIENAKLRITYCKLPQQHSPISSSYDKDSKTLVLNISADEHYLIGSACGTEVIDLPETVQAVKICRTL